jgi:hypothetical protein
VGTVADMDDTRMRTLERRIDAVEHRVSDIENGFVATVFRMERRIKRMEMSLEKAFAQQGIRVEVTEAEIDTVPDEA